ncbi:uncharacterized protein [Antedon mediterranea]|uniref:uncharacterized protein n=1 Tax=Antedon mediterranea TaxID=105859 RepID=UPI003AF439C4
MERPSLTCPNENVTVVTDFGKLTATVDYSADIIATDNSDNPLKISPDPVDVFPAVLEIGSHRFVFDVKDPSRNSGSCNFLIMVEAARRTLRSRHSQCQRSISGGINVTSFIRVSKTLRRLQNRKSRMVPLPVE